MQSGNLAEPCSLATNKCSSIALFINFKTEEHKFSQPNPPLERWVRDAAIVEDDVLPAELLLLLLAEALGHRLGTAALVNVLKVERIVN